ncbi:MAG: 3-hydroxyacyl-CoA dehydrogenase family protein [Syntrophales bacterium]|jgi:3-hydroxybutyryl-CoA dehydrogenase|nr:3-hydroxyacyl-CoA dehydrogenase family protein [Syntrophales bacterium]
MEIRKIMVVGSGFMGSGVAQVAVEAGYDVVLNDTTKELAERGVQTVSNNLNRQVKKGKISEEDKAALLTRISVSTNLEDAAGVDFVVEAAFEDFGVKKGIFEKLDAVCRPMVILATNTSSIPITKLAAVTQRPDRFIGMHFFSPVPVMRLVEVIPALKTSEHSIKTTEEIAAKMKKETVRVKDVPGFLVNRVNAAFRAECYKCLLEGVASLEDIDKAIKLGLNHPMGPFELGDFVGVEIGYNVFKTLYEGYKDPKFAPSLILEKLVISGDFGRKTGKGWYDYTSGEKKPRTDIEF